MSTSLNSHQGCGYCTYCSLILCNECIQLNKYCHSAGNGRSVCSNHMKEFKTLKIDFNRVLLCKKERIIEEERINVFSSILPSFSSVFKSFYSEFNNTAHYYDIFDHDNSDLWKSNLSFRGIYIFMTAELANIALRSNARLFAIKNLNDEDIVLPTDATIKLQACSQCNNYQARFPESRFFSDDVINSDASPPNYMPNFYSVSLCRKPNLSHDKKKKGGRKKTQTSSHSPDFSIANKIVEMGVGLSSNIPSSSNTSTSTPSTISTKILQGINSTPSSSSKLNVILQPSFSNEQIPSKTLKKRKNSQNYDAKFFNFEKFSLYLKQNDMFLLLESYEYSLYRTCLASMKTYEDDHIIIRLEMLKMISFGQEMVYFDHTHASPSLPTLNGGDITTLDIYKSIVHNHDSPNLKYTDMWSYNIDNTTYHKFRLDVANNLMLGFKNIAPILANKDHPTSKNEPFLYVLFKVLYYYAVDISNFDHTLVNSNWENVIRSSCDAMVECYVLYESIINKESNTQFILSLKNLCVHIIFCLVTIASRCRLLDLRSRYAILVLNHYKSNEAKCVKSFTIENIFKNYDVDSLQYFCLPTNSKYLDSRKILHYILDISLISSIKFSINFNDHTSTCMCSVYDTKCTHFVHTSKSSINYCVIYYAVCAYIQFGYDIAEEYFSKIYILYLEGLVSNDTNLFPAIHLVFDKIELQSDSSNFLGVSTFDYANDDLGVYRGPIINSCFYSFCCTLPSIATFSNITTINTNKTEKLTKSLPYLDVNTISVFSTLDEALKWIKLGLDLAHISKDINSINYASASLINAYFFWSRSYQLGVDAANHLIQQSINFLEEHQPIRKNAVSRLLCQANIVRYRSLVVQYNNHIAAGLQSLFFPDGKFKQIIYLTFEYFCKPIYITDFGNDIGVCWSTMGSDLSLQSSWRPILLDNIHLQFSGSVSPLMSQRFLFHCIRTNEYTFEQFYSDILKRNVFTNKSLNL